jgi:hypothetical protein
MNKGSVGVRAHGHGLQFAPFICKKFVTGCHRIGVLAVDL